jgi:23S rRNA pseudouridine1911/1915/1917 synthase
LGGTGSPDRRGPFLARAEHAGQRLDRWLAAELPDLSRARLQALIEAGSVLLDGHATRGSARVKAGQSATVVVPAAVPAEPQAEDIPLRIVHEDASLLVLDKPAGLVVHPGAGRDSGTLVNALLHHVRDLSGVGGVLRPGIVHRLDAGTSGLMVVAKDDVAHRELSRQFAGRTVEKDYLAVVLGRPRAEGEVDLPIGRDPAQRLRMAVSVPRARVARSRWRVVEALDGAALVRVHIFTGRTHQIRVHMASAGHPLVGDVLYGGRRVPRTARPASAAAMKVFPRPALHSARLAFDHPASGDRMQFESALPEDLAMLVGTLRA